MAAEPFTSTVHPAMTASAWALPTAMHLNRLEVSRPAEIALSSYVVGLVSSASMTLAT